MEDEIDLMQYIKIIFRHWKLVLGIALAAIVTAGIISFAMPPVYEATALLQSFEAVPARMSDLAKSGDTAKFILMEISDNLTPAERNPAAIRKIFTIGTSGASITCMARSADAQRSADLANAWAEAFTRYAADVSRNSLMSDADLQAQIASSYTVYRKAQSVYESFLRTSQVEKLNQQISDARLLLQALLLQEGVDRGQTSYASGNADGLAYLLIKAKSYTAIPTGIQLSIGAVPQVTRTDVNSLVHELEDRSGIHGKTAAEVTGEINGLIARFDGENQRSKELLSSRDAAWNMCLAAIKNAQEVEAKRSSAACPVAIINEATPPQVSVPPNRLLYVGIGLASGLILGVFAAFAAEYIEKRRSQSKEVIAMSRSCEPKARQEAKQSADNKP
jgi:capsular polysaccharide biosynthesis protein